MDKLGFAKLFGNSASEGENVPSKLSSSFLGKRPSAQIDGRSQTPHPDSASKAGSIKGSSKSKSRKKALSLMVVEPISRCVGLSCWFILLIIPLSQNHQGTDQESICHGRHQYDV